MTLKPFFKPLTTIASLVFSASLFAEVSLSEGYVRAVPPGQMNSAAFMQLENKNDRNVALVSAKSPASEVVELHTHSNNNGVMQMRQVEKFDIPAQGKLSLQPGGHHVMLIGLKRGLNEGVQVEVTLEFSDQTSATVSLPVKKVMAGKQMGHKHHHH